MTLWRALRAARIALLAIVALLATAVSASAQDISCERGDQEVRDLEFRGNRAISDAELALRVTTTPSSWGRRNLHLWFADRRCLDRAELPRDVLRLKAYYRERGYYSAQVDTLVQNAGKDAVRVVFLISEGDPIPLASYTVTGLGGIADSADIMRRLQLTVGGPFDRSLYIADVDSIVHRLAEAGYYRATAVTGYDWDSTGVPSAHAMITVIPGKQARFGEPVFFVTPVDEGGQQIANDVVRRVMGIRTGELYSERAITEAQRNLFQLGTYRHIEVAPLPDSLQPPGDTLVVLGVRLTEDYMKQLDSEYGWATLDCGRVRLQYTDRNLLGSARRLELTGQASKIGYGYPLASEETRDFCTLGQTTDLRFDQFSDTLHYFAGATLRQPRLLGTRWVPTVALYSERRGEFRAYLRSTQVGADFSATRDIGDRTPLRVAYTVEYGKTDAPDAALCAIFNRCDPVSRASIKRLATLGVASATVARIRTDNVLSPRRGTALRGEVRTSSSRLLGTSATLFFNKGTADFSWYTPFGWQNVLALRLRGGMVLGRQLSLSDPTGFIPPQERLYAGGPTSVRGFQQNELGSLVYIARRTSVDSAVVNVAAGVSGPDTTYRFFLSENPGVSRIPDRVVPLGGNALVVANIEYRVRDPFLLPDLLQYTFFLDGGDVWTRGTSSMKLKWTPGFGVRALTPVGPVQVNVGYNRYQRHAGQVFYNPNVTTLACATPDNTLTYTRGASTNSQLVADSDEICPGTFVPPARSFWYQKLTFTFSIGPTF